MNGHNTVTHWIATRRSTIIYWIATLWLALGMFSTGLVQLLKEETTVDLMAAMGFPVYFLTILGTGKILGVIAILIPKVPLVKEWAYAGFSFVVAGAAYTYIALGRFDDLYHLALLTVLIAVSWYLRPAGRTLLKR